MSVEQHNGVAWAHCWECGWEGPIRTNTIKARDDEVAHNNVQHKEND